MEGGAGAAPRGGLRPLNADPRPQGGCGAGGRAGALVVRRRRGLQPRGLEPAGARQHEVGQPREGPGNLREVGRGPRASGAVPATAAPRRAQVGREHQWRRDAHALRRLRRRRVPQVRIGAWWPCRRRHASPHRPEAPLGGRAAGSAASGGSAKAASGLRRSVASGLRASGACGAGLGAGGGASGDSAMAASGLRASAARSLRARGAAAAAFGGVQRRRKVRLEPVGCVRDAPRGRSHHCVLDAAGAGCSGRPAAAVVFSALAAGARAFRGAAPSGNGRASASASRPRGGLGDRAERGAASATAGVATAVPGCPPARAATGDIRAPRGSGGLPPATGALCPARRSGGRRRRSRGSSRVRGGLRASGASRGGSRVRGTGCGGLRARGASSSGGLLGGRKRLGRRRAGRSRLGSSPLCPLARGRLGHLPEAGERPRRRGRRQRRRRRRQRRRRQRRRRRRQRRRSRRARQGRRRPRRRRPAPKQRLLELERCTRVVVRPRQRGRRGRFWGGNAAPASARKSCTAQKAPSPQALFCFPFLPKRLPFPPKEAPRQNSSSHPP